MKLKDTIREDVQRVFLNTNEFAESIHLDGRKVRAIVEQVDLEFPATAADDRIGMSSQGICIYCLEKDVTTEYLAGKAIWFNDERWLVLSTTREAGLLTINLYRERA